MSSPHIEDETTVTSPNGKMPVAPASNPQKHKPKPERKKKFKLRIFKRLGYEKLNIPIALFVIVCSICLVIATVVRQAVQPTLSYCNEPDLCTKALDPNPMDIVSIVIGSVVSGIILILSVSLILAPGALMDYPRTIKIVAVYGVVLTLWSEIIIISPYVARRYNVIPYNRIANYDFEIMPNSSTAADIQVSNFMTKYYEEAAYKRIMVRVYRTGTPLARDIPPTSHYYMYSDSSESTFTHINATDTTNVTISRRITGLEAGTMYAFMVLPVREGSRFEVAPNLLYFTPTSVEYMVDSTRPESQKNISGVYIDFRIYKICKWKSEGGCE